MNELIPSKSKFIEAVKNHSISILLDSGINRHLRFCNEGSKHRAFDLVTYADHLVVSGDVGTFVFSRCEDMFKFFRSDELSINPCYWEEKLKSISCWGGCKVFDQCVLNQSIQDRVDSICDDIEDYYEDSPCHTKEGWQSVEEFERAFRGEVKDHFSIYELSEHHFVSSIDEFKSQVIDNLDFVDSWEWVCHERYSSQYIFCCYAIVWGVQQYDKHKAAGD